MRMKIKFLIPGLLLVIAMAACTKVSPEDPALSMKTRHARIKNDWKLDQLLNLGVEIIDSDIQTMTLEFFEWIGEDKYTWTTVYTDGSKLEEEGKWNIDANDKRKIVFEQDDEYAYVNGYYTFIPGTVSEYYLQRVAKKELWLRKLTDVTCDGANEFRFVVQ